MQYYKVIVIQGHVDFIIEACIEGTKYPISLGSKQASIPYKLANIPMINFTKYLIGSGYRYGPVSLDYDSRGTGPYL